MASNDPWPHIASSSSGKGQSRGKNNNGNKKKDHQQMVLDLVTEMFATTLEQEVILSLAQNCDWELQSTIDALIALSATVETAKVPENREIIKIKSSMLQNEQNDNYNTSEQLDDEILKMDEVELRQQLEGFNKFEQLKKNSTKNRMDSFRGNIPKLDTSFNDSQTNIEKKKIPCSPWNSTSNPNKNNDVKVWEHCDNDFSPNLFKQNYQITPNKLSDMSQSSIYTAYETAKAPSLSEIESDLLNQNQSLKTPPKHNVSSNKSTNARQLCGLQVHYRSPGTECSSDDDDADVVVEEEFNDYNMPSEMSVNVSQFLSSTVQTSPPSIQSNKVEVTTTASPPITPNRTVYEATLDRIKAAIFRGDKILVILRGLPGAGKTTLAKSLITICGCKGDPSLYIFSTDDYFYLNKRGVYMYDPTQLNDAHSSNQRRVYDALESSITPVIVDNTNLEVWEMRPYASMAVQRGYIIEILDVNTPWANNVNELVKKNIHGVPKNNIIRMQNRYERGITGQKLLERYSLKYPVEIASEKIGSINKENVLTDEDMAVLQNINQIPNTIRDEVKNVSKNSSKSGENANNILLNYLRELTNDEKKIEDQKKNSVNDLTNETSDKNKQTSNSSDADNYLLQPLGAIGSERKNSLVYSEVNNPLRELNVDADIESKKNVLSQCWDFTVLLNGQTFHSDHRDDHYYFCNPQELPMNADQMRKQDEEFGKEEQCFTVSPTLLTTPMETSSLAENDQLESHDINQFFESLTIEYSSNFDGFEQKKSTVIITEITEDTAIAEAPMEVMKISQHTQVQQYENITPCTSSSIDTDQINHVSMKHLESVEETKSKNTDDLKLPSTDEMTELESVESIGIDEDSYVNENCKEEIDKITSDEEYLEMFDASPPKSTLGSFLSMIKTSILGSNTLQETVPDVEDNNKIHTDNLQASEKYKEKSVSEKSDEIERYQVSSDETDQVVDLGASVSTEQENYYLEPQNKFELKDESSIQREKRTKLNDDLELGSTTPISPSPVVENEPEQCENLNNINRITWKESPFPLDDIPIVKMTAESITDLGSVSTADASTNTTHYDFNVAYVGGTSEPGYRVINASSRRIYEGSPVIHPERPKSKLMLDKSSMTDDVFNIKNDPDLNDEDESVDRVFELIELFPNIPREYLSEIYEKCMKNFDWTVEVLLDGVPDDLTIKVPNEIDVADDVINPESPSMLNNDTIYCEETNSCDMDLMKNQTSIEYFNEYYLGKHDGIEIDVKSLNDMDYGDNTETDIFDDASLHLTESDNQQELTESEKSPEPEETIELNLGCEFVRTLENQFGNPDFHMPDGFQPIISIKKSIAQELYALWIESMYQQLNVRHEQLDQMIAKDAEFAKSLEREMEMEEARGSSSVQCESDVPNLNEIMDMELALASYKNELKSILVNDKPEDMASRLSRQMLHESIPDMDPEIFDDILKAHNGNFKETFDIIESNTGRSITPCDTFKKSTHNVSERMKEESMHDNLLKSRSSAPIIVARSDSKCSDRSPHKNIVTKVANSRQEAQRQFSLRIDNFNKAAEAYRRGYPQVAAYYSQVVSEIFLF